MNKKIIALCFVFALLIICAILFSDKLNITPTKSSALSSDDVGKPVLDSTKTKTYTNSTFRYSIRYPDNALVISTFEEARGGLETLPNISIFIPGYTTVIDVDILDKKSPETLSVVANAIRMEQVEDKNPNLKAEVGALEKILVDGEEAFAFTLTGGFKLGGREYALGDGLEFTYVVTEHRGIQYLLHYHNDPKSTAAFDSFRFLSN